MTLRDLHFKAARTLESGFRDEVSASVSVPVQVGPDEWWCTVTSPYLFVTPKKISGFDAAHAQEMGEHFLRLMFKDTDFEVYED